MKEKIVVCLAQEAEREIQSYLNGGWKVKMCVAENLTSTDSSQPGTYAAQGHQVFRSRIVFILEA